MRLSRYWFGEAPAERLASLRMAVGLFAFVYLVARLPHLLGYAHFDQRQFQPVGIVNLLNRPLLPIVVQGLTVLACVLAALFTIGWRFRWVGPCFAALLLWVLTYRHSWGMVFHTDNLLVVHVIILGVTRAADVWSVDARTRATVGPGALYGWPIRLMCWVVVIAYFLAGVAKLRGGGMDWLHSGESLNNHIAIDNLRKLLLGDLYSPLATAVVAHPWIGHGMALLTLTLELGAPLALLGRRLALIWIIGVCGFHWGVLGLMMIVFPYQLAGVAFACFFPVEKLTARLTADGAMLGHVFGARSPG